MKPNDVGFFHTGDESKNNCRETYCDFTMQDTFIPAIYFEDYSMFWKDLIEKLKYK